MTQMFTFDASDYAKIFAEQDYVCIPQGLTEAAFERLSKQVNDYIDAKRMPEFARGNKQQSLYDFPRDNDFYDQFVQAMATLAGLDPEKLVISERHIKAYEADAVPNPMPHKDRLATELSVGFTIRNPKNSTLVLYPHTDRRVNPFQSWAELRAALPPEKLPAEVLKNAPRIAFQDQPRDVIAFRGNETWHLREGGADTIMLYFKINAFHSDPLGEDPRTEAFSKQTQQFAALPDRDLADLVPILARRIDYIHRRYNCLWQEQLGVVLAGKMHFDIDEQELQLLRAIDGKRPIRALLSPSVEASEYTALLHKLRHLAQQGIIDLLPPKTVSDANGTSEMSNTRVLVS